MCVLFESHVGYRKGRGCVDQLFVKGNKVNVTGRKLARLICVFCLEKGESKYFSEGVEQKKESNTFYNKRKARTPHKERMPHMCFV